MGMLRIAAHLINLGTFRKQVYTLTSRKKKIKIINSVCIQHTEETFLQLNYTFLENIYCVFNWCTEKTPFEYKGQYIQYSTITFERAAGNQLILDMLVSFYKGHNNNSICVLLCITYHVHDEKSLCTNNNLERFLRKIEKKTFITKDDYSWEQVTSS